MSTMQARSLVAMGYGRPVKKGSGTRGMDYKNTEYQPRRGKWERRKGLWVCSSCHLEQIQPFSTCPMCGAVMDR